MQTSVPSPTLELAIAIMIAVIALALAARRVKVPLPVFLSIAGLAFGVAWHFVPGVRTIVLPSEVALFVFLPPLLTTAAFGLPFDAFRANLGPIMLLAVGLVLATMAAVVGISRWILPEIPIATAFVLGAIVAPPDPVAATMVVQRFGIRNELVAILQGEGLVNDATAIVAYHLAIVAAATGIFSWTDAATNFVIATVAGIGVGLVIGWITAAILLRLNDPTLETAISLVAPYVAYLLGERLHGSAVLAVVTVGFFLAQRSTEIGSASTRLTLNTVWTTVTFLVEGAVFVLIGIQLGEAASNGVPLRLFIAGAAVSVGVIVVRMGWMYVVPSVSQLVVSSIISAEHGGRGHPASMRERTVLGWAGMRGVVSLALAISIPSLTAGGTPFAGRSEVVIVTFMVILVTLVMQGLTLAPLVRALGVAHPEANQQQEDYARTIASRAGRAVLDQYEQSGALSAEQRDQLQRRFDHALRLEGEPENGQGPLAAAQLAIIEVERDVILRLRSEGTISDEIASRLEMELDLDVIWLSHDSA